MQQNNLTPGKPMELPAIEMHGPYEVRITVRFKLPDGQIGAMDVFTEPGLLPTRAQQLAIVNALNDPAQLIAAGAPRGVRLLGKSEFIEWMTKRATGRAIPVPGNQEYVPASCEIPHDMLVHAIMGTSVRKELAEEYAGRNLLEIGDDDAGTLHWNLDLLAALPDTILLAMYQRITAPPAEGAA